MLSFLPVTQYLIVASTFPGKKYCACRLLASGVAAKAGVWSGLHASFLSCWLMWPFANCPALWWVVVCDLGSHISSVWEMPRGSCLRKALPQACCLLGLQLLLSLVPVSAGGGDSQKLARLQMMGHRTSHRPQSRAPFSKAVCPSGRAPGPSCGAEPEAMYSAAHRTASPALPFLLSQNWPAAGVPREYLCLPWSTSPPLPVISALCGPFAYMICCL